MISGSAGVGKTALAVQWGHQVMDRFPDGQIFVNLHGFDPSGQPMRPAEAVPIVLSSIGVPAERVPVSMAAQSGLLRSLLAGKRVLILLDNARDPGQVRPLLPGSPGSVVIVTSRNELAGLMATDGAHSVTLDVLTSVDAEQMVIRQLGPDRAAQDPQAVAELSALCARLPLALSISATRAVANPGLRLADLAHELRDAQERLDVLDAGEPSASVRAVISWSYHTLTDSAARVFRLLGLHPGPDISLPAVASLAGVRVGQARAAMAELARSRLLTEPVARRYAFHDLLRAYAFERAQDTDPAGERRAAIHRVLDHYLHTAHAGIMTWDRPAMEPPTLTAPQPLAIVENPGGPGQALAWFHAEHQALLAAVDFASVNDFDVYAWQLAWALSRFLDRQGHWHAWLAAQHTAVAAAQRLADRSAEGRARIDLGRAYTRLSRYPHAYGQYRRALDLYTRSDDQAGLALAHLGLCFMFERQGRLTAALRHAEQALTLYQALGHPNGQANAHNDIGCLHALRGNHELALASCELALTLGCESGDRFCQACAWDSLGYAHHHLGHLRQAITCYQRALELFTDLGDRFNQAEVLSHLGDTYSALAETALARETWQRALVTLGDMRHPGVGEIRAKLTDHNAR